MTINLYGIPNCSTVKRARRWLDTQGISYQFIDLRRDTPTTEVIIGWLKRLDTTILVNRKSTTWRQMDDADKAIASGNDQTAIATLLERHPTLIKRPVIDTGETLLVGFDEALYSAQWPHTETP